MLYLQSVKKAQLYEIIGHVQRLAAQMPLEEIKYSEYMFERDLDDYKRFLANALPEGDFK